MVPDIFVSLESMVNEIEKFRLRSPDEEIDRSDPTHIEFQKDYDKFLNDIANQLREFIDKFKPFYPFLISLESMVKEIEKFRLPSPDEEIDRSDPKHIESQKDYEKFLDDIANQLREFLDQSKSRGESLSEL